MFLPFPQPSALDLVLTEENALDENYAHVQRDIKENIVISVSIYLFY